MELSTADVVDLCVAYIELENEKFDLNMQVTAWQTALLINTGGNVKRKITPEKLYTPLAKQKKKGDASANKSYVDKQREELKKKFNIIQTGKHGECKN
jgi:hypothetical protein